MQIKPHLQRRLSANALNLMKLSPTNPTVRGLVLKQTGVNLPAELTTFEEIITFLEKEIKPPEPMKLTVETVIIRSRVGTARFKQKIQKTELFIFSEEEVMEIAADSDDWDTFQDSIVAAVQEKIAETEMSFHSLEKTESDDITYDEHNLVGLSDDDSDFDTYDIMKQLRRMLRESHPEMYEKLENGPE